MIPVKRIQHSEALARAMPSVCGERSHRGALFTTSILALILLTSSTQGQTMTAPTSPSIDGKTSVTSSLATRSRTTENTAIRSFTVNVPEDQLLDLKRRINATRWPEMETVADESQGVRLATIQALARYWATDYDWRKVEAKLNALPQFVTNIDGLDIHFVQVKSKEKNALPLIITHGWPGSIIEQLKIIDPLTNPTAYGGKASDAFDVVIPSMPGYGFSAKPTSTGWGPERIAKAWD